VEANITGGQGSRRAVAPSDADDDDDYTRRSSYLILPENGLLKSKHVE
jgi:hypothetical protein